MLARVRPAGFAASGTTTALPARSIDTGSTVTPPALPIRVQHRSGRLWILNGAALDQLPAHVDPCGRLYDQDVQLRDWLPPADPAVREASERLASYGVTHVDRERLVRMIDETEPDRTPVSRVDQPWGVGNREP